MASVLIIWTTTVHLEMNGWKYGKCVHVYERNQGKDKAAKDPNMPSN